MPGRSACDLIAAGSGRPVITTPPVQVRVDLRTRRIVDQAIPGRAGHDPVEPDCHRPGVRVVATLDPGPARAGDGVLLDRRIGAGHRLVTGAEADTVVTRVEDEIVPHRDPAAAR